MLGLTFNVFALLAVTLFGGATLLSANSYLGESWASSAGQVAIFTTGLQAGYILGLTSRPLYAAVRGRAPRASTRT